MCTQRVCSWCACSEGCADGERPASSQVSPGSPSYPSQTQHRLLALCLPQAGACCPAMLCEDVSGRGTTAPSAADGGATCAPAQSSMQPAERRSLGFPPTAAKRGSNPSGATHTPPPASSVQWNVLAACLERAFLIGFACLNCELVPGVRIRRQTLCPQGVISKKIDSFFVSEMKVLS